ncbi:glutamate-1-semialdehyde 2,1-aminomutase [Desulfohalovibrio reitneri]|uniref:glutamate-1-semialdehyde 2,1-aminomutase n=1 Tax=Desulfohalovibrio reitneri TaxID=1307759 RepID=UPI0004A70927|nr:glutamate-1-semialdehyde 2,1-aminomutase [Desulfohalovibrio reitneri]
MTRSEQLFARAQELIPGGVNSPVRACRSVGAEPLFITEAKGATLTSAEGEDFVDFVLSWGPMLLGHQHPAVQEAILKAVEKGASFGAPCEDEINLAEEIVDALPGVEMVRMVNSGTEATMSALRVARAFTGRSKVLKFVGCYHGHCDSFLASAGSGVATLSIPGTPGVPEEMVAQTLLAPYNDLEAVKKQFEAAGDDIAAVFVEPVAGNMGLVPPGEGFLKGLRQLCDEYGALLVFDEVITGFRVAYVGAQGRYSVTPDLTCMGKIIGGGMPVGAYGGRGDVMQRIAPCGDVYQAGTLAGNPVAMAAGVATLRTLKEQDYGLLEFRTKQFAEALADILRGKGLPVRLNQVASLFTLFFTENEVTDFDSAATADSDLYARFWGGMRRKGIYLAPSGFECAFTSFAHTEEDFEKALDAAKELRF